MRARARAGRGVDPVSAAPPPPLPPLPPPTNDPSPPAPPTRRLLEDGDAAPRQRKRPPPAPSSPPSSPAGTDEAFPARAMWINAVDRRKRSRNGVLQSAVVHYTASFSGVNATEDVDLNASRRRRCGRARARRLARTRWWSRTCAGEARTRTAARGPRPARRRGRAGDARERRRLRGDHHRRKNAPLTWTHFFFCAFAWSFAHRRAHAAGALGRHEDVPGEPLAGDSNRRRGRQRRRRGRGGVRHAAHARRRALGALCAVFLSVSLAATVAALLVIHGWIGPGAHRRGQPLFRGGSGSAGGAADSGTASGAAVAHRRLAREDDGWGGRLGRRLGRREALSC